jgi:urease accessory protein
MKRLSIRAAAAATFAAFAVSAGPALAHTGQHLHDHGALEAGALHPLTGADHLAAMVAVGLWAAALGGRAALAVPATFLAVLTIGAVFAWTGLALPAVEPMIAVSVAVLGLATAFAVRLPTGLAAALVGLFALFHGHAHGAEMPTMAEPIVYGLGFLLATAVLHGAGLALGGLPSRFGLNPLARAVGVGAAALGAAMIAG